MSERVIIGNVPPEASDEELLELLAKYSRLEGKVVQHVDGDGSSPGRMIELAAPEWGAVDALVRRLNGLFWKERELGAYHLQQR